MCGKVKEMIGMANHRWLGSVLADLERYCAENQMAETLDVLRDVQTTFLLELAKIENASVSHISRGPLNAEKPDCRSEGQS